MIRRVRVREETPGDHDRVREQNLAAFGGDDEARLVDGLRSDGLTIVSLVAEDDLGEVVGHIFFSPVEIVSRVEIVGQGEAVRVASLAPMAVRPDMQRQGIGTALVRKGIERCRETGWPAIIVVGHTEYYPRFGFNAEAVRHLGSPYAGPAFMGLDLRPGFLAGLRGEVRYPEPFSMFV